MFRANDHAVAQGSGIVTPVTTSTPPTTFPPVVYVPCDQPSAEDGELTVDLRRTADGRTAILVYSALDRLVRCCGNQQPWIVMPTAHLDIVDEHAPYDIILLDVEIPSELRRGAGER